MSNDYILSVIWEYADESLREPRCRLPRGCFEQRSYQKWAVDEIVRDIASSKFTSPVMVVENFIHKMDGFSRRNYKNRIIFSIAYDVATDILDMLLALR